MSEEQTPRHAPEGKKHTPVLSIDYEKIDEAVGYGDAIYMDIGQSTWSAGEFSAKVWRIANGRWSRQSEELPLSRVLDLAILVSSAIMGKKCNLNAIYQNIQLKDALENFITENSQEIFSPKLNELREILQINTKEDIKGESPNIFSFASSELSQDAMFMWLISWAHPKYESHDPELHSLAVNFLRLITKIDDLIVKTITVGKQWKNIDVWAEINDEIFLTIEDKTVSTIHDDQLSRYKECVEEYYPSSKWKKCFAYIKTGNEPNSILGEVKKAGYQIVLRQDILDCLYTYRGTNVILQNYRNHLQKYENETKSYENLPVQEWNVRAWEGFYKTLEKNLSYLEWSYVSNPSGGFLGAWWHFLKIPEGQIYLQFEEQWFCFKISVQCDRNERSFIRDKYHNALMNKAKEKHPEIKCPNRFATGWSMTIAKVAPEDFFGIGCINMENILKKIKEYEVLINEIV